MLDLRRCSDFSLVVASGICCLVGVCGHLVVVASLVSEHRLSIHSVAAASGLRSTGSAVVVHGLGCSK